MGSNERQSQAQKGGSILSRKSVITALLVTRNLRSAIVTDTTGRSAQVPHLLSDTYEGMGMFDLSLYRVFLGAPGISEELSARTLVPDQWKLHIR